MIGYRLVKYRVSDAALHPVTGKWFADTGVKHGYATSLFKYDYHWKPGLNIAQCIAPYLSTLFSALPSKHVAPEESCMCGFYAWTNVLAAMDEVVRRGQVGPLIMLKIFGSGKVIEHEYGWRAEEVTPFAALWAEAYSANNEATVAVSELLEIPLEQVDVEYTLMDTLRWTT